MTNPAISNSRPDYLNYVDSVDCRRAVVGAIEEACRLLEIEYDPIKFGNSAVDGSGVPLPKGLLELLEEFERRGGIDAARKGPFAMIRFLKLVQGIFAMALCFYRSGLRPMAIQAAVFSNEGLHFFKGSREP